MYELRKRFNHKIVKAGQEWLDSQPAWLGNLDGVVQTADPGIYYARLSNSKVIEVYNTYGAPPTFDLHVKVARNRNLVRKWQIMDVIEDYPGTSVGAGEIAYHHEQHMVGRGDMIPIDRKQLMAFTVFVSEGAAFKVVVFGGITPTTTGIHALDHQVMDLSSLVPASGALYVGIEVDDDLALSTNVGTNFGAPDAGTIDYVPEPAAGKYSIAYVLLYYGQTVLQDSHIGVITPIAVTPKSSGLQIVDADADTPADGDFFGFWDIVDSALKKITWANIKATLKTYFDTLYAAIAHTHTLFDDGEGDPADVTTGAAADGTSDFASRRDHVHHITSTGGGHVIQDEGTPLTARSNLNFVGGTVVVTDDSGNDATVVTVSSSAHVIQDETTPLTARANLNFTGAGVVATDNAGTNSTDVTIAGGSGHTIQDEGTPLTARTNLNFTGGGVTVTDDAGNNATDVDIPAAPTTEEIQDIVGAMMTESGGIGISYDDVNAEVLFDVLTPSNSAYSKIDGWETPAGSQSYSSADAPIFVISFAADVTGVIYPGVRIKLTQTTVKYFIVVAVGAYSGGVTLVTVYGGTDYTLANSAIADLKYSYMKCPRGFPIEATKWTVTVTDTSMRSQTPVTAATWYYMSITISAPIGVWKGRYQLSGVVEGNSSATAVGFRITLSTGNGTESDAALTCAFVSTGFAAGSSPARRDSLVKLFNLTRTTKATYYMNAQSDTANANAIRVRGDFSTTIIELECAYL